ncbi:MAG: RagB/SusD family nutrient uptake outer membrane protein [Muribaculaceae bacterium]|nr:RagB/SusD family nutrient uptake outer membrane protein [Muribaculaceae bacterium]
MKKIFINSVIGIACVAGMTSCGDKFLETDYFAGVEAEGALTTPNVIEYALNGTYFQLQTYYFAGNYSTIIGDIASDITYWNQDTGHFNQLYQFIYQDTDTYLRYIWEYGYKVIDNTSRIIEACEDLIPEASEDDLEVLKLFEAEARTLRAFAALKLTNVFCHQAMVNGTSYGNMPGIVIIEKPVPAFSQVERSTINESYAYINKDLTTAINLFEEIGWDRDDVNYMGLAAAYGLYARSNMYLENWKEAAEAAENAILVSGIDELAYSPEEYKALYNGGNSNWESFFTLGLNSQTSWSANSLGTLFTTYGYSSSPYLESLYGSEDCRLSILYYTPTEDSPNPYMKNFSGGKFGYYGGTNPSYATCYEINAPEMFLIQAEAYAKLNNIPAAQEALLVVAKRNNAITSVADLPASADGIMSFLYEERARELFQEGFRFFDLRRWNIDCNLYAVQAPAVQWMINNVKVGDVVLPIPAAEVNTNYGVTQNDGWSSTRPK